MKNPWEGFKILFLLKKNSLSSQLSKSLIKTNRKIFKNDLFIYWGGGGTERGNLQADSVVSREPAGGSIL